MSITTNGVQPNTWLQQLPANLRSALDRNSDGNIAASEVVDFLTQLIDAVKTSGDASYDSRTGAPIVTKPTTPPLTTGDPLNPETTESPSTESGAARTWLDYVFGRSSSGNYAGVMVEPSKDVPAGYHPGPYRGQLEGFNDAKFDPTHAEGMTLKMIAGRVFEQFDVYSETAIDDVVKAFNDAGVPATKQGIDQIDFNNGEGPIDVIRNAAWLDGNKAAGMAWQWAPVNDGTTPMNFTMGKSPGAPGVAGSGGATGGGTTTPVTSVGGTPAAGADQINAGEVDWLHGDVSNWAVTSNLTGIRIAPNSITLEHTKAGQWPVYDFQGAAVEGNPWVLINRGGKWVAATYDWLRPGQTEKAVSASDLVENAKSGAFKDWKPQPGETVGFMVSTIVRNGDRTSNERSNIVLTRWPA